MNWKIIYSPDPNYNICIVDKNNDKSVCFMSKNNDHLNAKLILLIPEMIDVIKQSQEGGELIEKIEDITKHLE